MKKISEKLKILRKAIGYTQKEMSVAMSCGYSTVGHYESGRIIPTITTIENLCNKFPQYTLWLMTDIANVKGVINQSIEDKSL